MVNKLKQQAWRTRAKIHLLFPAKLKNIQAYIDNLLSRTIFLVTHAFAASQVANCSPTWLEGEKEVIDLTSSFECVDNTWPSVLAAYDLVGTFKEFVASFKSTRGLSSKLKNQLCLWLTCFLNPCWLEILHVRTIAGGSSNGTNCRHCPFLGEDV